MAIQQVSKMGYLTEEDFAIAAQNGVSRNRAHMRYYVDGWSKERALTEPVKKHVGLWKNYKAKCAEIGISRTGFFKRLGAGLTPEQASSVPVDKSMQRRKKNETTSS
jgi:hypothetical protein